MQPKPLDKTKPRPKPHDAFNYPRGARKNLEKKIYRLERQYLQGHPDCKISNPADVKETQQKKKLPQHCIDKLTQEWEAYQRRQVVPPPHKEPRMNRL